MTTVDYNTQRTQLLLPEYGRCIQQMVEHAKTIDDRDERLRCANTIVQLMAGMVKQHGDAEEFRKKLWNHLAAIANYELDIDYPVEIERLEDTRAQHESIPYPQKRIARRHYGAIVEALTQKLADIEDEEERMALTTQVANQMKRDLARWNKDAVNNEKVLDDIFQYTEGRIGLHPEDIHLLSDAEILSSVQQQNMGKKKKRK